MVLEGKWYPTAQAADERGVSHYAVRWAMRVGKLKATQINPRLNMVTAEAIDA